MKNLLLFCHGQLIKTISESSSRLFRTESNVRNPFATCCRRFAARSLFRSSFHPPPYRKLSYVVFVVGTIEDCIRGVQNVVSLFYPFRSWQHALLHFPRLNCCRWLIKKDRGRSLLLIGGGGRGGGWKKLSVQFYFQLPVSSPTPHFLFRSAAAGLADLHSLFFLHCA